MAREVRPLAEVDGPHGRIADLVVGPPGTIPARLADFIAATGVDEPSVRRGIHDHAARVVVQPTRAAWDHARSKRSRFITLFQAATKSRTNFSCASALP